MFNNIKYRYEQTLMTMEFILTMSWMVSLEN